MNQWDRVKRSRSSRRRVLAATGSSALGAALLAACGGSSSSSGSVKPADQASSSVIAAPIDETKNLKRGGVYKNYTPRDIPAFEPHTFAVASIVVVAPCYSNLFHVKEGYLDRSSGEIEGDLVESWEMSPDKTQLTVKMNPNAHFSPQAPTNGRAVDAKDVVFSWDRIKSISSRRGELANDVNPNAPIVSMTAPDEKTVVIKTNKPYSALLGLLAIAIQGLVIIAPKEGADPKVLDLRTTVRGSGPWYLDNQQPGVSYSFKRNPGFQQDKRSVPYIDQIDWPVISEYAAGLAQFKTGAIYSFNSRGEDVLPLKRETPDLVVMPSDFQILLARPFFGLLSTSPFKDQRVRQAYMMTLDRDLFLDAFYNVSKFQADGVKITTAWESAMQADNWKGWVLDPRDKDFGPNAKYFKKDVAEAKKMMAAAGFTTALSIETNTATQTPVQSDYDRAVSILAGMADESGLFKTERKQTVFNTEFIPKFQDARGQFDGMAFGVSSLQMDPANYLRTYYHPQGSQVEGSDTTFGGLIDKALGEFDDKKRMALLQDVQRREGETMYFPRIGSATGLSIAWPILRNRNVWQGGSGRPNAAVFLDPSQAPVKKA